MYIKSYSITHALNMWNQNVAKTVLDALQCKALNTLISSLRLKFYFLNFQQKENELKSDLLKRGKKRPTQVS